MSLPDSPVKRQADDRLNRAAMAKHIARLVNDFTSTESFVVGIEGEWGSGKSSFINFVCEDIDPEKAEIIFFNPWNFSSQDQLIDDFFNALLETIEKVDTGGVLKDTLRKYKRKLKRLEINPSYAGASLGKIEVELSSLSSLRSALEKQLEQFNKKVVIIIDDIDRLDTTETLAIFKLVKVTANFPNCIFFLAYDRHRVIKRVDQRTNQAGEDYLKKIIQTTFRLPSISRAQIKDMALEHIDTVLTDLFGEVQLNADDTERWSAVVYSGFPDLFQNIRDLKRYASSLRLNLSVIGQYEVNLIDFVVLEAIRVFAADFYDEIPRNRWIFTQDSFGLHFRDPEDKRATAYEQLVEKTLKDNPARDTILKIMEKLFPRLDFNVSFSSDMEERWAGNKQACSVAKFDAYFQLAAPPDEISEQEFEGMMEEIAAKDFAEVLPVFEKLDTENRLRDFLKKTHGRFDMTYKAKPDFFSNVAKALFVIIGKVKTKVDDFFDLSGVDRQLQRLIWRISEQTSGEESKYQFLKGLFSLNPGIYYKVDLLRRFRREKVGEDDHLKDMAAAVSRTIEDLLPDLQRAIDTDTLKSEPYGNHIIWGYTDWGKGEELKNYASKLAEDEADVFIVLRWFRLAGESSSKGRYYRIDKQSLSKLVDLPLIEKTLAKIDAAALPEDKKELYDLYHSAEADW